MAALTADGPADVRTERLYLLHESGALTDAAFKAAREALFQEERSLPLAPSTLEVGPRGPERERWRVQLLYANTAAEAKEALASGPSLDLALTEVRSYTFALARALSVAGRYAEAIPKLTLIARRCHGDDGFYQPELLPQTLEHVHAHLYLGQALEATGDKTQACREYAVVQTTWRDATPRSVTLEKANERARALGCPPI